ncbi:hypothetical protein CY34DRAFT_137493 [Suillus luteus UH-Slu-Lm8-n1]|uniref:Uncharacterized protein n=1 Tax=Suillus luteus UH-Slu-Lm8-n1 TaxID=930992 RepID=A0A0D0BHC2_9AGAM|nr:hypothetical protein CY34DRAFT_137493 [Suillus luteus UH-Slu-Lm8-n1]
MSIDWPCMLAHLQTMQHRTSTNPSVCPFVSPITRNDCGPFEFPLTMRMSSKPSDKLSLVALDLMEVDMALADAESVRQTVTVWCSLVHSALGKSSIWRHCLRGYPLSLSGDT